MIIRRGKPALFGIYGRWAMRLAGLAGCLVMCGCAGYRLGTTLPPGISRVNVPTFVNETAEPLIETDTTQATIQRFQQDGTLKVTGMEEADAQIEVTLINFTLEPLRYGREDTGTVEEYRLRITAELEFKRLSDGVTLLTRRVQGNADFDFTGDLATSKRVAMPEASADLARDIVEAVVEYW